MLRIRVDDYPGTKPDEFHKHNLENFKRFDHYVTKHGVKEYVLGIIPMHAKVADLRWIGDRTHIVPALHGLVHPESRLDELGGLPYANVQELLRYGRDRLEGICGRSVDHYIPPHNTISADTVLALSRLGFDRIFGGPETDDEMKTMVGAYGMEYCHSEPPLEYGRSDELLERGSVEHLLLDCERDVWLTLHWPWECNIGFEHLDKYLSFLTPLF